MSNLIHRIVPHSLFPYAELGEDEIDLLSEQYSELAEADLLDIQDKVSLCDMLN